MPRQELLDKVEQKEFLRVDSLAVTTFIAECLDWYGECEGAFDDVPYITLLNDYMTDFMRWQRQKTEAELLELI